MKRKNAVIAKIVIVKIVIVAIVKNVIVHKKAPIIWHDDRRPNGS
jgi:hypothetical protein